MQNNAPSTDIDMSDAPSSTTEAGEVVEVQRPISTTKDPSIHPNNVVPSIEVTNPAGIVMSIPLRWLDQHASPRYQPRRPSFSPITPPSPRRPSFSPITPPSHASLTVPTFSTASSRQRLMKVTLSPHAERKAAQPPRLSPGQTPKAAIIKSFNFKGLPAEVKKRIYAEILVHPNSIELHQKRQFRRITEAQNSSILTVGIGKSTRTPENRHIVPRGLNTNSPTNLFLVCKRFRDVGLQIYYGKNDFVFSSFAELEAWMENIQGRRKFVQHLTLRSSWEVGFTKTDVRREMLRVDHLGGVVVAPTIHLFANLQSITLDMQCIEQWRRWDFPNFRNVAGEIIQMSKDFAHASSKKLLKSYSESQLDGMDVETSVAVTFIGPPVTEYWETFHFDKERKFEVKKREKPKFQGQIPPFSLFNR